MKLLVLTHYFESHRGGVEIVAGRLAREWTKAGLAVTWLASDSSLPPTDCKNVTAISLPASNIAEHRLGLPYPLLFPAAFAIIFREARDADIIIAHDGIYLTSLAAFAAARWYSKPIMIVQHIGDVPYRNSFMRGLMKLANRLLVRPVLSRADQCIFISEATVRTFADVTYRAPPKLIFNGVDTAIFSPAINIGQQKDMRALLNLPQQGMTALFVGRFVEKKGLPVLERLARLHPDVTFAIAGWGSENPRNWGLPNVFVFEGLEGATLAPLYQASDVFILPSAGEGFPLVVQEALACGLPVICGDDTVCADPDAKPLMVGIPVDLSNPEKTATLFSSVLTSALEKGWNQEGRVQHAKFAAKRYSWASSAADYAEIMKALVKSFEKKQSTESEKPVKSKQASSSAK